MKSPQLCLGTAQWGMDYGWANESGRPSVSEVESMLNLAWAKGVRHLDTAQCYGEAENLLGVLGAAKAGFSINTKLGKLELGAREVDIRRMLDVSLKALQTERLGSLMVHDVRHLLDPAGEHIWDVFRALLKEGCVQKIGVSIYHLAELDQIIELEELGIVQLPLNVYDQRFLHSGWLKELKQRNVKIQVRSVFLQGILSMRSDQLPIHLHGIKAHQTNFIGCLKTAGMTPIEGALQFCLSQPEVDQVVVGCESFAQLQEILTAVGRLEQQASTINWHHFSLKDGNIINPTLWPPRPTVV
jgi:aryl-alcohol dehydrogenase-like predicted oxidoreductase